MTALGKPTLFALAFALAVALLATITEAHSWADCVDWRFNDPKKPGWTANHGKCFGWARKYPLKQNTPFGGLDGSNPPRHYRQDPNNFISCSNGQQSADESRQNPVSKSYGGSFGHMATVKAGGRMCIRWPAKNHAVQFQGDRPVFINMPPTITKKDPSQDQLMKMTIAKLKYKNCNPIPGDTDRTPCGGCFRIPADRKPGTYMLQWRWELNPNEFYTSCWDLKVIARGKTGKRSIAANGTETGNETTLGEDSGDFSELL